MVSHVSSPEEAIAMHQSQISNLIARLEDLHIDPSISRHEAFDLFSIRSRKLVTISQA
jgi:hypothetical protein